MEMKPLPEVGETLNSWKKKKKQKKKKEEKEKKEKKKSWIFMKKEKCYGCKQYFPKKMLLFDYCSGNQFCLNCYKNQFAVK